MAAEENMKLWTDTDMLLDLCFVEYRNSCRDNNIVYKGDFKLNVPSV